MAHAKKPELPDGLLGEHFIGKFGVRAAGYVTVFLRKYVLFYLFGCASS